jgi:hypothetical protein
VTQHASVCNHVSTRDEKNAIKVAFQSRDLAIPCCPLCRIHPRFNTSDERPNFLGRYTGRQPGSATLTTTLALAGGTTGRPRSTFPKTLATAVVLRRKQMGETSATTLHTCTVHNLYFVSYKKWLARHEQVITLQRLRLYGTKNISPICFLVSPRFSLHCLP